MCHNRIPYLLNRYLINKEQKQLILLSYNVNLYLAGDYVNKGDFDERNYRMLYMIQYFLLTLAVAAAGGLIGYKLKLPVGGMVGSMIAVIIFNVATEKAVFYSELRIVLQIFSGAMIGSQIGREDLLEMKKIIYPTALLLVSMVLLNLTFGTLMYVLSDLDLATALFASSPGGVSDMAIISADLGANPAYVAIIQLCRLLTIFIFMPPIFRKIINSRNNKKNRNNKEESIPDNILAVVTETDNINLDNDGAWPIILTMQLWSCGC